MSVLVSLDQDSSSHLPLLAAVKQLWGDGDHMAEIDDMLAEQEAIHGEKAKSVCDLFRDQAVRWQLITLFLVVACMQLLGVNVVCVLLFSAFSIAYSFLAKSKLCNK